MFDAFRARRQERRIRKIKDALSPVAAEIHAIVEGPMNGLCPTSAIANPTLSLEELTVRLKALELRVDVIDTSVSQCFEEIGRVRGECRSRHL